MAAPFIKIETYEFQWIATPATNPLAAHSLLYFKSDGLLYSKNPAGAEALITAGYAPLASPTFTGTVVLPSTTSIGTITNTELSYIDGLTSSAQTQIDGKIGGSIADDQIAFGTAANTIGGSANITYDGTAVTIAGSTTNSTFRVGTLELQNYGLSNSWIGDNVYYNGTFVARATGPSAMFYFQGAEGQFRLSPSVTAGSTFTPKVLMKLNASGRVTLGGNASTSSDGYAGATIMVTDNGMSIGKNGTDPVASALIEMTSTTKGFLPPVMTAAQGTLISSPAEGLLIYVTDTDGTFASKGFWGYTGAAWTQLG